VRECQRNQTSRSKARINTAAPRTDAVGRSQTLQQQRRKTKSALKIFGEGKRDVGCQIRLRTVFDNAAII